MLARYLDGLSETARVCRGRRPKRRLPRVLTGCYDPAMTQRTSIPYRATTVRLALIAVAVFSAAPVHAVLPDPAEACSVRKLRSAVVAFTCQLRIQSKVLLGRNADASTCSDKLTASFAKAEAGDGCILEGDAADADSQFQQAALDVFASLGANAGPDDDEKRCIVNKSKAIARHAKCQSLAFSQRILGISEDEASDFTGCAADLAEKFAQIEASDTCMATGDLDAARDSSGAGYGYLAGAPLRNASLESALLPNANLANADLYDADFSSADVASANFSSSSLERTRFDTTDAHDADFSGSDLVGADVFDTDLSNAIFAGTSLFAAFVEGTDFTGTDLSTADLRRIEAFSLTACPAALPPDWTCRQNALFGPMATLTAQSFPGLDLSSLNLEDALFDSTNLSGANLSNTNLRGITAYSATFENADLSNVDMTGAEFRAASFENANVTGAVLNVVEWTLCTCPDGVVVPFGGSCCGHHVGGAPAACSP
jgi:uncharacterized protein YjbI with pentapeptide repeats